MRIGIALDYSGGFHEAVDRIVELEKAGIDIAVVAEAYSFDAVSQLGYLAAKTSTIELASGVFPIYIRTPSLLAMTAAGLDFVSDGRFTLGIGTFVSLFTAVMATQAILMTMGNSRTISRPSALGAGGKKRGWTFVGPTTVYAFMQAMGLVNDHLEGCVIRAAAESQR